jgi:hypothetical protein
MEDIEPLMFGSLDCQLKFLLDSLPNEGFLGGKLTKNPATLIGESGGCTYSIRAEITAEAAGSFALRFLASLQIDSSKTAHYSLHFE